MHFQRTSQKSQRQYKIKYRQMYQLLAFEIPSNPIGVVIPFKMVNCAGCVSSIVINMDGIEVMRERCLKDTLERGTELY